MLESVKQLISNAKKLNQSQLIVEVFTDVKIKDEIVYYITEIQLFEKGVDGLGKKLKQYTPFTISEKKKKGQKFSNTTLEDTGQFYSSFRVDVNDGQGGIVDDQTFNFTILVVEEKSIGPAI